MDLGIVRQINIDVEMQASYLDYAMSVIVARALPDARDGLKPVHRRILYAMHDLGLTSDKPYKKSARIVGEVLGKYHPHGDVAVYEAMVRMAQEFSLRYPLVDGQGNFGSVDGDNAAAMRYTEARLAPIAAEMLNDIEKDTVEWTQNFDGTLREPLVLPAALPNLVINGSSGIAVGMATNIPPHNLGEVCDALCFIIDNYHRAEDITIEDLTKFIQGPDFPTGGVVYRYQQEGSGAEAQQVDVIARAYAAGKGPIVVQAKAHIEEMSRSRNRIVITELPYQTDKSRLIERIAELVRDGRLEGLTDLRDESDRTGMRVMIELTRTVDPREVLAELYRLTPLQSTFGVSLLALVDGEPRLLSLKRLLLHFLEHRQEVITRRSKYELKQARARAHVLEGLLRALDILDEIIALIRGSRTAEVARRGLIEQHKFSEIQAQAILDMQLRRLAALERRRLTEEYQQVLRLIKELETLLDSPKKLLALIRQNLVDLKACYGDARRTQIADTVKGTNTAHDIVPDSRAWIGIAPNGTLLRRSASASDGLRDILAASGGAPLHLLATGTRDDLYLFTARGQATRIPVHRIPEGAGSHYSELSGLRRQARVVAVLALPKANGDGAGSRCLVLGTVQGRVKRVDLADLMNHAQGDPQVINLGEDDALLWVGISDGSGQILLVSAAGQAIRFAEEEVRVMGLPAGGIGGIRLRTGDGVIAGGVVSRAMAGDTAKDGPMVAVLTANGYGKRLPLAEFPVQGRNGQGVVAAKLSDRSGRVAGAAICRLRAKLLCRLSGGGLQLIEASALPESGRASAGKVVLKLAPETTVQSCFAVVGEATPPESEVPPKASRRKATKPPEEAAAPEPQVTLKATRRKATQATEEAAPAPPAASTATQPEKAPSADVVASGRVGRTRSNATPAAAPAIPGTQAAPGAKASGVGAGKVKSRSAVAAAEVPVPTPAAPGAKASGAATGKAKARSAAAAGAAATPEQPIGAPTSAPVTTQPTPAGKRARKLPAESTAAVPQPMLIETEAPAPAQPAKAARATKRPAAQPGGGTPKKQAAAGSSTPDATSGPPKPKVSAAEGPLTWPLLSPEPSDDDEPPPPPALLARTRRTRPPQ